MIIKRKETATVCFEVLEEGEVFYDKDSERYYMKIAEYDIFKAVDLETGLLVEFCGIEKVTKVNAILIIE